MTFKLRIPGDGTGHKSLSSCENSLGQTRPALDKKAIPSMKPKEFTITPDCGTIRPQGFTAIRVRCPTFQYTLVKQLSFQVTIGNL